MARNVPANLMLDDRLRFPDPRQASRDGLVAFGGNFSSDRLLLAYRSGIFPWTDEPITWWSPDPRAIFDLNHFHVSRSFAKFLRKQPYTLTLDRAFRRVMEGCAAPSPGREETWISPNFIAAYTHLHELGHAHSVECWRDNELVGGIYGVAIGGLFAGESMFHRADNASKVALHQLITHLRQRQFALFDIQLLNDTTQRLGAIEIRRDDYLDRLRRAVELNCSF